MESRKRIVVKACKGPETYPYTAIIGQVRKRYRWRDAKRFETFYAAERWLWRKESRQ